MYWTKRYVTKWNCPLLFTNVHSNLFLEVPQFVTADTSPRNMMSNRAVEKQTNHLRIGEDVLLESDHDDELVTQFITALNTSLL